MILAYSAIKQPATLTRWPLIWKVNLFTGNTLTFGSSYTAKVLVFLV